MINGVTSRNLLVVGVGQQLRARHGRGGRGGHRLLVGHRRLDRRRAWASTSSRRKAATVRRVILRHGRERLDAGQQHRRHVEVAGIATPNELKRVYDINPSLGGSDPPRQALVLRSLRFQESSIYQAGAFGNKNSGDLTKWTYEPEPSKPGRGSLTINPSWSLRSTWQATPRNKIGFSVEPQNRHWINAMVNVSSENYPNWQFKHES